MTDIVGIMRFSVLSTTENPFVIAQRKSFDDLAAEVLDPARLDVRFRLFEHITLPSLDAQTQGDFTILLVAPRLLPQTYRDRLDALAASRSYLHLVYADETDFKMKGLRPLIVNELVTSKDAFTTFRIDDDDAVSRNFIERIRRFTKPEFEFFGVSLCNGYLLDIGDASRDVRLKHKIYPNLAVGLSYVARRRRPRIFYDVTIGHVKMHHRTPVVTDARSPAYLALTHSTNDTGSQRVLKSEFAVSPAEAQATLDRVGFTVDLPGLMRGPTSTPAAGDPEGGPGAASQ
ncbi:MULTISPECIES: glycosyltransferase [Brevundimonas]|uniref:glycosyltransferase n=1 Tax=Brevundimonas TaxID=41275 RepID=UPI0013CE8E39|nr:glycosyltransferase [Brevundimonas lutea]